MNTPLPSGQKPIEIRPLLLGGPVERALLIGNQPKAAFVFTSIIMPKTSLLVLTQSMQPLLRQKKPVGFGTISLALARPLLSQGPWLKRDLVLTLVTVVVACSGLA
ncbi:hypothetical protein QYF36_009342 [Acer negundo]|nr:hypothetical protein QYF36_009342 [Acer negundo]